MSAMARNTPACGRAGRASAGPVRETCRPWQSGHGRPAGGMAPALPLAAHRPRTSPPRSQGASPCPSSSSDGTPAAACCAPRGSIPPIRGSTTLPPVFDGGRTESESTWPMVTFPDGDKAPCPALLIDEDGERIGSPPPNAEYTLTDEPAREEPAGAPPTARSSGSAWPDVPARPRPTCSDGRSQAQLHERRRVHPTHLRNRLERPARHRNGRDPRGR